MPAPAPATAECLHDPENVALDESGQGHCVPHLLRESTALREENARLTGLLNDAANPYDLAYAEGALAKEKSRADKLAEELAATKEALLAAQVAIDDKWQETVDKGVLSRAEQAEARADKLAEELELTEHALEANRVIADKEKSLREKAEAERDRLLERLRICHDKFGSVTNQEVPCPCEDCAALASKEGK